MKGAGVQYRRLLVEPVKTEAPLAPPSSPFSPRSIPGHNHVDVWFVTFAGHARSVVTMLGVLAPDERERAERFRSNLHRQEFILSHGYLREILSCYLQIPPAQLCFQYNAFGKPALREDCGGQVLSFNLSHSSGAAVYAVSDGRRVGIDMERVYEVSDLEGIATRFFSAKEADVLRSVPPEVQLRSFFSCWTLKEAYLKAIGRGLSADLKSFDMAFAPGQSVAELSAATYALMADRWVAMKLDVPENYVAALAMELRVPQ